MPDINTSMGTGGGGGLFSRKTELVADLTSAFKELNRELEKTKKLSEDISKNLKNAKGSGGGGGSIFDTSNHSSGTKDAAQNDGSQSGGNGGFNLGNILKTALNIVGKGASAALQAMPTVEETLMQNTMASQAGFASGRGLGFGNAQAIQLGQRGTFGSPNDVYAAQGLMTQYGMQGSNNAVFQSNVAAMSNLVPTGNGADAVRAVQALNQAKNVNMLRMIGVNVRGADGMMKNFKDIAKDLWNTLNKQKQGGREISKSDIDFSLQPGNALDSLLNQYFGNDPVLRQGVVNELKLLAGGAGVGKDITRQVTESQGLSTGAINSKAALTAKQVATQEAAAKYELKGYEEANKALGILNDRFQDLIKNSKALQKVLEGKGFLDTMSQGGHNAMSAVMGALGAGGVWAGSKLFKGIKGLFGGGGGAAAAEEGVAAEGGSLFSKFGGFLKGGLGRVVSGLGVYEGMEWLQKYLNKEGAGLPDWLKTAGNFAFDTGEGALTGLAVGKNPFSAVAGAVAGGYGAIKNPYGKGGSYGGMEDHLPISQRFGEGGSDTSADDALPILSYPVKNNPPITSPFGKTRFIIFDNGQKSPSYGKPHGGVDYGIGVGTPVYAVKDGVAEDTVYDTKGFGNYGKIKHEDGRTSYYGHMSSVAVKAGQKVKAGDLIGYSGNSGNSTGPHLHFEVRENSQAINPLDYIRGATTPSGDGSSKDATSHPIHRNMYKITGGAGNLVIPPQGGEGVVPATTFTSRTGHSESSHGINYGGVNITMNFPPGNYDKEKIKEAVREVMSYDNVRKWAVSR